MTTMALYPWETAETVDREQIEAEILADAEFQQWFDSVMAGIEQAIELGPLHDQPQPAPADPTAGMDELQFMEYTFQQLTAQPAEKVLSFADQTLRAPRSGWGLLPAWQRDEYVGA